MSRPRTKELYAQKAVDAVLACARDFDWDAVVPNQVYVWTGLSQAAGLRYYAIPGIDIDPDSRPRLRPGPGFSRHARVAT